VSALVELIDCCFMSNLGFCMKAYIVRRLPKMNQLGWSGLMTLLPAVELLTLMPVVAAPVMAVPVMAAPSSAAIGDRPTSSLALKSTAAPPLLLPNRPAALPAAILPTLRSAGEGEDYVLGAGDRLRLDLFSVPEFSGDYQVLPNGTMNLPRIGSVTVQGLTLKQASAAISLRYRNYLTRPIATLSLLSGRPVNVAIAGEVNRPGSYVLNSAIIAPNGEPPTLTRLLQTADGITQAADLGRVMIRRQQQGGYQVYTVNLWQLVRAADSNQDLRLQDGDSIYIPETKEINLVDARQLASLNFATRSNRPLRIAVIGEVNRPGPYSIFEGNAAQTAGRNDTPSSQTPSVTQALQIAGGITQMADLRKIQVRRLTRSGKSQQVEVNFQKLLKSSDVLQDLPLQDGDVVEIARATTLNDQEVIADARNSLAPDRINVNIVGEVKTPGSIAMLPNTPLNQALLTAGGFNDQARKQTVELVRLEPNGTVSKREIAINFAEGVSEKSNPSLRAGDTVIVRKSALAKVGADLGIITNPIAAGFSLLRLLGILR
jgi:polysaccharide biosynthesis/export protein